MFCKNCGKEIEENSTFCPSCGAKLVQEESQTQVTETKLEPKKGNGMAIAGFVCSFFIPLLGWIFGGVGLAKSKKTGKGLGFSIAAIAIATVMFFVNLSMLS